jgi:hypothetical protein
MAAAGSAWAGKAAGRLETGKTAAELNACFRRFLTNYQ